MHFPRFWAKGSSGKMTCWRWSDVSVSDAERLAVAAAAKMDEVFRSGDRPLRQYGYPNTALREPVLRQISDASGTPSAAITRNAYGCQVLNTARVMFVDVDFPEPKAPTLGGFLGRLFGGASKAGPTPADQEAEVISKAEAWNRDHESWGWRIYRTRGGMRLMATHSTFEPDAAATAEVFESFGADPLYRRLCHTQKSFRARLTPKSWRCGLPAPDVRWPWDDPQKESRFLQWDQKYQGLAQHYATCKLVSTTGPRETHPDVVSIVRLHDEMTKAESALPLA
jgi:hypothetical protein